MKRSQITPFLMWLTLTLSCAIVMVLCLALLLVRELAQPDPTPYIFPSIPPDTQAWIDVNFTRTPSDARYDATYAAATTLVWQTRTPRATTEPLLPGQTLTTLTPVGSPK